MLQERLDRVLWNTEAMLFFPEAKVVNLPRLCSDHNPILFCTEMLQPPPKESRPFRFEAAWLTHSSFKEVFEQSWSLGNDDLLNAIHAVTTRVKEWKEEVFGNIFQKKKKLWRRIQGIQNSMFYGISNSLQQLEVELINEYQEILAAEEVLWLQKSRMEWICNGERNTKFFHLTTVARRNFNRVTRLKIDGEWTTDPIVLKDHVMEYFHDLFGAKLVTPVSNNFANFRVSLKDEEKVKLLDHITLEEVKKALFSMKGLKSPGPDGIQPIFLQRHWVSVQTSLLRFVKNAMLTTQVPMETLKANTVLIPKGTSPDSIMQFRPITLLNTTYKVLSKVLVNRMRSILQRVIGPYQNSFLAGRSTSDNILVVQELVHTMMNLKGRKGSMILKLDIHKAYDTLNWDFLQSVLLEFGFPTKLIDLIMFCVRNMAISVIWNGEVLPEFMPKQGLRQGDPLSPYLFILAMEKLSQMILSEVANKDWIGVKASRKGPAISHLFFLQMILCFLVGHRGIKWK